MSETELIDKLEKVQNEADKWFERYSGVKLQLKKANFDLGVLKSEVDELKYDLKSLKQENHNYKQSLGNIKEFKKEALVEAQKDKLFILLRNENKAYKMRNEALSKSVDKLILKLNIKPNENFIQVESHQ